MYNIVKIASQLANYIIKVNNGNDCIIVGLKTYRCTRDTSYIHNYTISIYTFLAQVVYQ